MRLKALVRTVLTVPLILTGLLVAATAAHADCEYQGSRQAGSIDCLRWAEDETPGNNAASIGTGGAGTAQAGHSGHTGNAGGTPAEPVCRDGSGAQVPCSIVNDNGTTCYFGDAIGTAPSGSGGAVYLCSPPPEDEDTDDTEPGDSPGVTPVDPVVLTWRAITSLNLRAADLHIAPTPLAVDPESMGLVGLPVWLWTPDGTWGPHTATASDGPVSVTVTARIDRVEWDMGDGTTITCRTPGTAYDPARHTVDDRSPDCGHVYQHTSHDQPDGVYTVTATSHWTAAWTTDAGATGTIPFELTTSEQIRIGEMQVLRASRGNDE
jgi:hypothetical protein